MLCAAFPAPPPAAADQPIKKMVLQDCPQALSEVYKLNETEKRELVSYLLLVLKLQQQAPGVALPADPRLPMPLDELRGASIWTSFEPNRQIEAKRCALDLLRLLVPFSLEAVPDLVRMARDRILPPDFSDAIEETSFAIAARSSSDWGSAVPEKVLETLTEFLGGDASLLAENILFELQQSSVPYLVQRLKDSDPRKCDAVCRALLGMDPRGGVAGPRLLDLMRSGDADLIVKIAPAIGRLPDVYESSIPILLGALKDASGLQHDAVLTALESVFADRQGLASIRIDQRVLTELIECMRPQRQHDREVLGSGLFLLTQGRGDLAHALLPLLNYDDDDLRIRVIPALAGTGGEQAAEALARLFYDKSLPVRLSSIVFSGVFKAKSDFLATAWLKLLKSNNNEKDPTVRTQVLLAVAEALKRLAPGASVTRRFSPYMLEALASDQRLPADLAEPVAGSHPAAAENGMPGAAHVLVSTGKDALPGLFKAVESGNPVTRVRAAFAISRIQPVGQPQLAALAGLLGDPDSLVREVSQSALLSLGNAALAETRKVLKSGKPIARLAAAEVLAASRQSDKAVNTALTEGLIAEPCPGKARLLSLFYASRQPAPPQVINSLAACITPDSASIEEILDALAAGNEMPAEISNRLLEVLISPAAGPDQRMLVLARSRSSGIPADKLMEAALDLLTAQPLEVDLEALKALGSAGPAALPAVKRLLEFQKSVKDNIRLSNEVALTLAKIDPGALNIREYLYTQLRDDRSGEAHRLALAMGAEAALPVLTAALKDFSGEPVVIALLTLGDLGSSAAPALPQLKEKFESKRIEERYQSVVAVMKIDPLAPELAAALRRLLVSTASQELVLEDLPTAVRPLLESVVQNPQSQLEKRNAQVMLDRLPPLDPAR